MWTADVLLWAVVILNLLVAAHQGGKDGREMRRNREK